PRPGPFYLEDRADHPRPGGMAAGPEQLARLALAGVREHAGRGRLRIARGGNAPGEIREILPHLGLVNAPGGPGVRVDVDQARDDRLARHVDDARAGWRRARRGHAPDAGVGHEHVTLLDHLVALHR